MSFKKRKTRVTIIASIICKDAIIMASDSQLTDGLRKSSSPEKISVLHFANRNALIAEAGLASLSRQAVDYMRKKAPRVIIEDDETVANLLVEAVRYVRHHQIGLCGKRKYSPQKWKDFFRDEAKFELTTAHYDHELKPQLLSIEPSECVARKSHNEHFTTSGCGPTWANTS